MNNANETVTVNPPPRPQLKMTLDASVINSMIMPEIPDGFTLRTLKPDEMNAYFELMHSAGFGCWNEDYAASHFPGVLGDGVYVLVENCTGRLAATTMANKVRDGEENLGGEFGWVAVHPDFRGRHFADIVGRAVILHYQKAGYTHLYLKTDDFRIPAIKTYLKQGWKPLINDPDMQDRWNAIFSIVGR